MKYYQLTLALAFAIISTSNAQDRFDPITHDKNDISFICHGPQSDQLNIVAYSKKNLKIVAGLANCYGNYFGSYAYALIFSQVVPGISKETYELANKEPCSMNSKSDEIKAARREILLAANKLLVPKGTGWKSIELSAQPLGFKSLWSELLMREVPNEYNHKEAVFVDSTHENGIQLSEYKFLGCKIVKSTDQTNKTTYNIFNNINEFVYRSENEDDWWFGAIIEGSGRLHTTRDLLPENTYTELSDALKVLSFAVGSLQCEEN